MIICTRYLNNENYEGLEIREVKRVSLDTLDGHRCLTVDLYDAIYLMEGYETVIYEGGIIIMRFNGPECVYLAQDFDMLVCRASS